MIDWYGGEQPVSDDTIVAVEFRNGDVVEEIRADELDWNWGGEFDPDGDYDIVRYRKHD